MPKGGAVGKPNFKLFGQKHSWQLASEVRAVLRGRTFMLWSLHNAQELVSERTGCCVKEKLTHLVSQVL